MRQVLWKALDFDFVDIFQQNAAKVLDRGRLAGDDERDFGDMLTDDGPGTEELAMREVEAAEVRKALAGLTDYPGDRAVIEKVFGIDGEPLADVDVARQMGVSRSRVQQRKARGLQTLEHAMEGTKSKRTRGRT